MTDEPKNAVRERYERAVGNLTETLQRDRTVLAALLCGSLAYDEVWEKSDIDLVIIGDETHKGGSFVLTEENVNIHATVHPRSAFKKAIQGSLQSSFFHSYVAKGRLLFTRDESIYGLLEDLQRVGERDKAPQLLRALSGIFWALPKAEKWLLVKRDCRYSFFYLLTCTSALAQVEVIAAGQVASREVIQQALVLNPAFFQQVYTDLIDSPKDEPRLQAAIAAVHAYVDARTPLLFRPLLDYLAEAGAPRSSSEIDLHFRKWAQVDSIAAACEWLSDKGVIDKVPLPLRLSPKSLVTVSEAGYYYDPEA